MAATAAELLIATRDNYARILLLCTATVDNPTAANVDALTTAAASDVNLRAKVTYTVDGQNVNWMEFQQFLIDKLEQLQKLIVLFGGPYEIRSRVVT